MFGCREKYLLILFTLSYPFCHAQELFPPGVVQKGFEPVEDLSILDGKVVALMFGAKWCRMMQMFRVSWYRHLIGIDDFYEIHQVSNETHKPLEIIYISSDRNQTDHDEYIQTMPWLNVNMSHPITRELKWRYRIWSNGFECKEFGVKRRSGIPSMVIINKYGQEFYYLDAECHETVWFEVEQFTNPNFTWDTPIYEDY